MYEVTQERWHLEVLHKEEKTARKHCSGKFTWTLIRQENEDKVTIRLKQFCGQKVSEYYFFACFGKKGDVKILKSGLEVRQLTELQLLEGSRDHVILLNMLMSNSNIYSSPDLKPIHLMKLKKSTEKKNQKKKPRWLQPGQMPNFSSSYF